MADLNSLIDLFSGTQAAIWQGVSVQVSERAGMAVAFNNPLVTTARPADVMSELMAPAVFVQFAFASSPESAQIIVIQQESALELATALLDRDIETLDEDVLQEVRPNLEAVVQGLCLALTNVRNEPFVATGLSVRYQIAALPPNLQNTDTVVRANVAWEIGASRGVAIWVVGKDTLAEIVGGKLDESEEELYGKADSAAFATQGSMALAPQPAPVADGGLDILLDVPLDISVELGRVKLAVKEILELRSGSIVELDRVAGEPIDVLVNGRVVARGEVVVIEDNFGVRVTEILTPVERLRRLGERE